MAGHVRPGRRGGVGLLAGAHDPLFPRRLSPRGHGAWPVPAEHGPFDLYDFVGDDDRQALFDRGFLPGDRPPVALRFLRPLSSALLFYTHLWLAPWPILMHLHFFAWWVVAVLAARDLFRLCVAPRAAAFATVIFALAPCHSLPIGWLANGEALEALAFGTVGLSALLRWQRGGRAGWACYRPRRSASRSSQESTPSSAQASSSPSPGAWAARRACRTLSSGAGAGRACSLSPSRPPPTSPRGTCLAMAPRPRASTRTPCTTRGSS